jgi:hypothetical protein
MNIKNIGNNILLVSINNQYELCSTFIRLQEFYESPYDEIKGNFFTLEQFMDVYAREMGNFTYFTDWTGFNVPGNIVNNFYHMHKNMRIPVRTKEKELQKLILSENTMTDDRYYVIGCINDDYRAIKHEVAHALFYLDSGYFQEISILAEEHKLNNPGRAKALLRRGYDISVINDEIQAYCIDEQDNFKNIFEKYLKICKVNYESFKTTN